MYPFTLLLVQSTLLISTCSSQITAYLEVKLWSLFKQENLITGNKILWKRGEMLRSNFSSFPQYFQYSSYFKSQITYSFVKCGYSIYFFLNSTNLISQSISKSPFDLEILRVDCIRFFFSKMGATLKANSFKSSYILEGRKKFPCQNISLEDESIPIKLASAVDITFTGLGQFLG